MDSVQVEDVTAVSLEQKLTTCGSGCFRPIIGSYPRIYLW